MLETRSISRQSTSTHQPLGLEAAVELERHFLTRDVEIARYFGLSVRAITGLRGSNLTAWCYWEERLHDGSRAPKLTWEEHSHLKALARAARITQAEERLGADGSGEPEQWTPGFGARLLFFFHRITGVSMLVIGGYFAAVWLAHHF